MKTDTTIEKQFYQAPTPIWTTVGDICHNGDTAAPSDLCYSIFEYILEHPTLKVVSVIDENFQVIGVLTRSHLMELFGGQYGYSLHSKKKVEDLMSHDFLVLDASTPLETASKLAMMRPTHLLYDDIIVTRNDYYVGIVSVKDLLESAVSIQLSQASNANPLSGLPGNSIIDNIIKQCLSSTEPFAIAYLDLDNFKAYNDAYGFHNGDLMLKTVVQCMKDCCTNEEFMGHIGGDDFVIISKSYMLFSVCEAIIRQFSASVQPLYNEEDWKNGFIRSKNRKGQEDVFPIISLSISIITNQNKSFPDMDSFSKDLVVLKKKSKHQIGNNIQMI